MCLTSQVTVVVVTRNRWPELRVTLDRLGSLPERPPLVVVDNGSSDGTPGAVERHFPDVELIGLSANRGAAARTIGARLATTPLVAFSDDDSWWESGALAAAADLFAADAWMGLVAAHLLVGKDGTADPTSELMANGRLDEWLRCSNDGPRGVTGFLACAAVVRRRAFLATGGFEHHLLIGGEEEMVALDLWNAGWKLLYAPGVVARHHPSDDRDVSARRRLLVRNHLLSTWLRYPLTIAARRSIASARQTAAAPRLWPAWAAAVRSAPWALAYRSPVEDRVARAFGVIQDT